MLVSQKCQYALRALFELARREGSGPAKIAEIAEVQAIPPRFLEVILSQLKRGGFVESRRGSEGGYTLARRPAKLTVGDIIRFVEGPIGPVTCLESDGDDCPLGANCVFLPMWEKAHQAMSSVYDGTTLQDLLDQEQRMSAGYVPCYSI